MRHVHTTIRSLAMTLNDPTTEARALAAHGARLRRLAKRQDYVLRKGSNRYDHGMATYWIIDASTNVLLTSEYGMGIEEVEEWLNA